MAEILSERRVAIVTDVGQWDAAGAVASGAQNGIAAQVHPVSEGVVTKAASMKKIRCVLQN